MTEGKWWMLAGAAAILSPLPAPSALLWLALPAGWLVAVLATFVLGLFVWESPTPLRRRLWGAAVWFVAIGPIGLAVFDGLGAVLPRDPPLAVDVVVGGVSIVVISASLAYLMYRLGALVALRKAPLDGGRPKNGDLGAS